jgi:hypothetical protein
MTGLVVALVVVVLVAAAVMASKRVRHPEDAAGGDDDVHDSPSDRFYRGADRPAGPDAEDPILPDRDPPPPEAGTPG